jgi:hypothetical protein
MAATADRSRSFATPSGVLRLATLGEDSGLLDLMRALVPAAGEDASRQGVAPADQANDLLGRSLRWTTAVQAGPELHRLAAHMTVAPQLVDWQQLLGSDQHDLILVAGRPRGEEALATREEQLRRLFQGTIPLVLVHPACEMILAYELEMIRKDTGVRVFPYVPLAERPELDRLRRVSPQMAGTHPATDPDTLAGAASASDATASAGGVEQWIWERTSDDRSRDAVIDDFARDALVLRELLGEIKQVTAVGGASDEVQYGQLTVHLTAAGGQSARWSILPTRSGETPRIRATAIGSGPSWTWEAHADGADGRLAGLDASPPSTTPPVWATNDSPALAFWRRVLAELARQEPEAADAAGRAGSVDGIGSQAAASVERLDWEHVCRGLELTDGVERSCRRRRTIDLYHEQVSEQATFKSLMAAGGCAMLFWVLAMLMVAGLVDAMQLSIRESVWWRFFPVAIFLPLGFFLGLQLLQLVFPASKPRGSASDSAGRPR